jgi:diguanylate cyclase (GGDEF)-like protein/PAS domain S-box-containing protein
MFGYTEEEFLRIGVTDIHPKESLSYVLAEFEAQARGEKLLSADLPCQRKDGSLFYADVNAIVVTLDGRRCNVGFFTDVTERKKAEEALRGSEERYRSIFESIQDVFYRTDAEGIITEISPSIERFGYTREQLVGTQVLEVYENPEERSGLLKALLEQGEVADHEIRLKTGDGRLLSISVSAHILRGPDGTLSGVEGTLRDISERKRAEQALRESEDALHEQARRDPLTGVLNHGAILDEMRSLISTGEHATPWAAAMIDVDRLKVTNDTYGHQVGDAVLVAVAAALSRDDALVGRYGGDEFVAILPGADRNAAERYRKDATDALAHATITDPKTGSTVRAEASIGLAVCPEDGITFANLLKVSDSAMYAVKRQRHDRRRSPRKPAPGRKAA